MRKILHDCAQANKKLITSESGKMYNLYILSEDGSCEPLGSDIDTEFGNIWSNFKDNCFNPIFLRALVTEHDFHVTETFMRKIVISWVENRLQNSCQEIPKCMTTYWGEVASIVEVGDTFEVSYLDPYTNKNMVLPFSNVKTLDMWLESNYSPYYEKVKDWSKKKDGTKETAWSVLRETRSYSSTSCVPPKKQNRKTEEN